MMGNYSIAFQTQKIELEKPTTCKLKVSRSNQIWIFLELGLKLRDGITRPAEAKIIEPPLLWDRVPPIRVRKTVPDSWLEIIISEGRNRQVRRMTAAIGYPTLRLIRIKIGDYDLKNLMPGDFENIS